jgi:hypothetical protein
MTGLPAAAQLPPPGPAQPAAPDAASQPAGPAAAATTAPPAAVAPPATDQKPKASDNPLVVVGTLLLYPLIWLFSGKQPSI